MMGWIFEYNTHTHVVRESERERERERERWMDTKERGRDVQVFWRWA